MINYNGSLGTLYNGTYMQRSKNTYEVFLPYNLTKKGASTPIGRTMLTRCQRNG